MSKPVSMIFATSGSGKSHFIDHDASSIVRQVLGTSLTQTNRVLDRQLILDGDEIIQETIGWPSGEWWNTMDEDELDNFVESCVSTVMAQAKESFVLFGVFPRSKQMFERCLEKSGLSVENCMIMEISLERLERNMSSRAEQQGPDDFKPTDAKRSWDGLQRLLDLLDKDVVVASFHLSNLESLLIEWCNQFKTGVRDIWFNEEGVSFADTYFKGRVVRSLNRPGKAPTAIINPHIDAKDMNIGTQISPNSELWRNLAAQHLKILHALRVTK